MTTKYLKHLKIETEAAEARWNLPVEQVDAQV